MIDQRASDFRGNCRGLFNREIVMDDDIQVSMDLVAQPAGTRMLDRLDTLDVHGGMLHYGMDFRLDPIEHASDDQDAGVFQCHLKARAARFTDRQHERWKALPSPAAAT